MFFFTVLLIWHVWKREWSDLCFSWHYLEKVHRIHVSLVWGKCQYEILIKLNNALIQFMIIMYIYLIRNLIHMHAICKCMASTHLSCSINTQAPSYRFSGFFSLWLTNRLTRLWNSSPSGISSLPPRSVYSVLRKIQWHVSSIFTPFFLVYKIINFQTLDK